MGGVGPVRGIRRAWRTLPVVALVMIMLSVAAGPASASPIGGRYYCAWGGGSLKCYDPQTGTTWSCDQIEGSWLCQPTSGSPAEGDQSNLEYALDSNPAQIPPQPENSSFATVFDDGILSVSVQSVTGVVGTQILGEADVFVQGYALDPGQIAAASVLYHYNGTSWDAVASSGWTYSTQWGTQLTPSFNWGDHPAGPGYYLDFRDLGG